MPIMVDGFITDEGCVQVISRDLDRPWCFKRQIDAHIFQKDNVYHYKLELWEKQGTEEDEYKYVGTWWSKQNFPSKDSAVATASANINNIAERFATYELRPEEMFE